MSVFHGLNSRIINFLLRKSRLLADRMFQLLVELYLLCMSQIVFFPQPQHHKAPKQNAMIHRLRLVFIP